MVINFFVVVQARFQACSTLAQQASYAATDALRTDQLFLVGLMAQRTATSLKSSGKCYDLRRCL